MLDRLHAAMHHGLKAAHGLLVFDTMHPFIPVEVQEQVIDALRDDPSSLRVCSLVCHAWLPRARLYLFRSIVLHPEQGVDALLRLLQDKPFIRSFVHQVSVSIRRGDLPNPTLYETVPIKLYSELPHLRTLAFRNEQQGARLRYASFRPTTIAYFRRFSSIRTMYIGPLAFPACTELVRFIAAFPTLRHFHCNALKFRRTGGGVELARRWANSRIQIKSLDVST